MAVSVRITFFRFINHRPSPARSFPIHAAGIVQVTARGDRQLGRRPGAAGRHVIHGDRQLGRSRAQRVATISLGPITTNRGSRDHHRRTRLPNTFRADRACALVRRCLTASPSPSALSKPMACSCTPSKRVSPAHRWWCWPTVSPSSPIRGATRSRRWPPPATTWWPPISAATAAPPGPADIADYNIAELSADLIGLLDDVGAEKAVFIGHDWGAPVAWSSAQLIPTGWRRWSGLSVPPIPRAQIPPTQAFRAIFGDNFFYMLHFQEPGVADAELDADPAKTLSRDDRRPARSGTRRPRCG